MDRFNVHRLLALLEFGRLLSQPSFGRGPKQLVRQSRLLVTPSVQRIGAKELDDPVPARGLGQGAANLGVRDGQIFIARIRPWREDDARRDTRAMPCEELPPIAPCDRWPADGVRTGLLIPAYHRRT